MDLPKGVWLELRWPSSVRFRLRFEPRCAYNSSLFGIVYVQVYAQLQAGRGAVESTRSLEYLNHASPALLCAANSWDGTSCPHALRRRSWASRDPEVQIRFYPTDPTKSLPPSPPTEEH
jgi:hypothetical protein